MMWLPASFASAIVFGIGGFLFKVSSHKNYPSPIMFLGLYLAGSLVFLAAFLVEGKEIHFNTTVLLFSVLIGLGSYYGNSFLVRAYDTGPACLTSPLMSINILLVVILSAVFYGENLTRMQLYGIGCMVAAVSLLGSNFKNTLIKSKMWAVFIALAILFIFMREGGLKVAKEFGLNNQGILLFAYLFSAGIALQSMFPKGIKRILENSNGVTAKANYPSPNTMRGEIDMDLLECEIGELPPEHENLDQAKRDYLPAFLLGTTIGVFSASGMSLLAFAIDRGPASIIVPIFSMRNFVAVILLVIFFKEKLPPLQWCSVALLITGVLLISQ